MPYSRMMDAADGRDTNAAPEDIWRRFVSRVTDRLLARFAGRTLTAVQQADIFGLFHEMASAGSIYAMLSPFFLSCELFASERAFARRCMNRFGLEPERPRGLKIAHFTDTFAEVNGVARTIQQEIELAGKHGKDMESSLLILMSAPFTYPKSRRGVLQACHKGVKPR